MRLVSYLDGGRATWGALDEASLVVDLGALLGARYPTVRDLLAAGALDEARHLMAGTTGTQALNRVTLLPPVTNPARILCAGVNYEEHRIEVRSVDGKWSRFSIELPLARGPIDSEPDMAVEAATPGDRERSATPVPRARGAAPPGFAASGPCAVGRRLPATLRRRRPPSTSG